MKLTIFVADKLLNAAMKASDLRPDYKVFASRMEEEIAREGTDSDESFIGRLLEIENSIFWVPAVIYNNRIYSRPGIKEISDGETSIFVL